MAQRIMSSLQRKLNVLHICPTDRWSTTERQVLRDAKLAAQNGHQSFVYCLKESYLAQELTKHSELTPIFHSGKTSTSFLRWHKFIWLMHILKRYEINLVHCYDHAFLWPVCFYLGSFPLIPLVFSPFAQRDKSYARIWYRFLVNRIDQIFAVDGGLGDYLAISLGVANRKIKLKGYGLGNQVVPIQTSDDSQTGKKPFVIAIAFPPHWENWEELSAYFYLAFSLRNSVQGQDVKFHFLREGGWEHYLLKEQVAAKLKELGLEEGVELISLDAEVGPAYGQCSLWLNAGEESLEDYGVAALLAGLPVLLPRTVSTMSLLKNFPSIGESYQRENVAEMRAKCLKIIAMYEHFCHMVRSSRHELEIHFGTALNGDLLLQVYQTLIFKRERLFARKPGLTK